MAVHEIFGCVGLSLVQGRITVHRGLDSTVNRAGIQDVGLVGRKLELSNARRNVTDLDLLAELVALQGSLPDLSSLEEIDLLAVERPACVGDALGIPGKLDLVGAVDVAHEEVAATAVVREGCVADPVKDLGPVRGELGVAEPPEGQHHFRGHETVRHGDVGGSDIPAFILLFLFAAHCAEKDCGSAECCA